MREARTQARSFAATALSKRLTLNEHVAALAPPVGSQPARGLLVVAGGFGARIGADRDRLELLWPASLLAVQTIIESTQVSQRDERQTWLDWEFGVHGKSLGEALFLPASMLVWYVEFEVLQALGLRSGCTVPPSDDAHWNQLLDDLAGTVPPTVHWLDRPADETARLLMHAVLNAEIAGNSQGKCFLRICSNQSASLAPSADSRSTASAGVIS